MATFGALSSPIQAMLAQSSAFGAISDNISNMRTGGYKSTDVRFQTVMASRFFDNSDVGGVIANRVNNIEQQGALNSTDNPMNLAISGKGLFIVNGQVNGSGEELYTRDGNFELRNSGTETINGFIRDNGDIDILSPTGENPITFTTDKAYLADKSGNFVQGYTVDEVGTVTQTLGAMRVDQFAFVSDAKTTSTATLINTLPATASSGTIKKAKASIFDTTGSLKSLNFVWTKSPTQQQWNLNIEPVNGTLTSLTPATFDFSSSGELPSGTSSTANILWNDAKTNSVEIDLSLTRSIGSDFIYSEFQKDGRSPGDMQSFVFDQYGNVNAKFSNGVTRAIYKIPVASFTNTNGLEVRQGNLFAASATSGTPLYREVDKTGLAQMVPFFNQ